jgi:hypothetical protein
MPWMSKSLATLTRLKQAYAGLMLGIGRVLDKLGWLSKIPPISHRRRHWAYSLFRIHDSAGLMSLEVPWWTYGAIARVTTWLDDRGGTARVYEYGSGASTVWLSSRAKEVDSVEHHRGFGEFMTKRVETLDNVTLRIVEPVASANPVITSRKEGNGGLDFADYVNSIDAVEGSFDLIVIDGRAREACLAHAKSRLAPDGLIVFDNTRRRRYRVAIRASGMVEQRFAGLTPSLPYPDQTSLLTFAGR